MAISCRRANNVSLIVLAMIVTAAAERIRPIPMATSSMDRMIVDRASIQS
jgi:hypothetical protein